MGRKKIGTREGPIFAAKTLGTEIKIARTSKKWTQKELAARCGVSPRTISQIERGELTISIGNFFSAADLVGVKLFDHDTPSAFKNEYQRSATIAALIPKRVTEQDMSHVNIDF